MNDNFIKKLAGTLYSKDGRKWRNTVAYDKADVENHVYNMDMDDNESIKYIQRNLLIDIIYKITSNTTIKNGEFLTIDNWEECEKIPKDYYIQEIYECYNKPNVRIAFTDQELSISDLLDTIQSKDVVILAELSRTLMRMESKIREEESKAMQERMNFITTVNKYVNMITASESFRNKKEDDVVEKNIQT